MAMHGDVLLDADRIAARLLMRDGATFASLDPADVRPSSPPRRDRRDVHAGAGGGTFYNNPLWTLNAYAFSGRGRPGPRSPRRSPTSSSSVTASSTRGLRSASATSARGSSWATSSATTSSTSRHLFDTGPADPAEATRRTELMADAMAAYFGVHKKGLALNAKRVVDALLTLLRGR